MKAIKSEKTGRVLRFEMTADEFAAGDEEYNGLCLSCGEETIGGTEPDAREYPCEACGENKVCGYQEAMIDGRITILE